MVSAGPAPPADRHIKRCSTEVPKYRSTEVPKYRSTEVPKYRSTEVPRCRHGAISAMTSAAAA
ncbi:hypothetical protein FTI75_02625 [Burkholderia pseudomallei]|nr:hypothetical protein FTI75_02625 [Burkholderia pseudomallei]